MIEQLILIFFVITSLLIIGLVLIQQGKGADMGASFGSGGSQTVFGVQGGGNLLTRWTAILAFVFFACSLSLAYFAREKSETGFEYTISLPDAQENPAPVNDEIPSEVESSDVPDSQDIPQTNSSDSIPE